MERGKFLITDAVDPLLLKGLEEFNFEVDYQPEINQISTIKIIADYSGILVTTKTRIDSEFLDQAARLKYILRAGSGMENIDLVLAAEKNIICLSSPEGNRNAVAEHVMAMLLGYYHRILPAFDEVKKGNWPTHRMRTDELDEKTIGIIGFGNTGSALAEKLQPFHPHILAYDKYKTGFGNSQVEETTMDRMYESAEIVSMHVPYSAETHHLCNASFFSSFKKEIVFVNASRGKVCNLEDLCRAILSGRVKFALLDVLENENLDNYTAPEKKMLEQLIGTESCMLTPHIAGKSIQSPLKIASVLLSKLKSKLS